MNNSRESSNQLQSNRLIPVIAIGTAAEEISALPELLGNFPHNSGAAYVLISPAGKNSKDFEATLAKSTLLPVVPVAKETIIEPDILYIVSPNSNAIPDAGKFIIELNPNPVYANMPVNRFFTALADSHQELAVGILLPGIENDGTMGLKAIKLAGGLTFAKDGKEISSGHNPELHAAADLVLPVKLIGEEVYRIFNNKQGYFSILDRIEEEGFENNDEDISQILQVVKKAVGVDFSQYKMNTVKRRVIRRMTLLKMELLKDYLVYIRANPSEITLLYQDLLINVTSFFRDKDTAEYVKKELLPKIIKNKAPNDPIRIWVPACSTGEEAYSIAMLAVEALGENLSNIRVQIFATDLSETAIHKARLGIYGKDDVMGISPTRLQRFFTKMDGSYRVVKSIRDLCVFANHNVAKDPPFSRLDIITCCNLLIYLDTYLQKKLMATFHYSLNSNGYLILGKSETVGTSSYLFSLLEKKHRIYAKKKEASAKAIFEMNHRTSDFDSMVQLTRKSLAEKIKPEGTDIERTVDTVLLKKYTPASVLVNQDLDIIQFRGSTGLYLEPSPGKASLNLMKMAKPGLEFELRNVVHKAKKTGAPASKSGLEINIDGKVHKITVEATPLKNDNAEEYYLVVFEQMATLPEEVHSGSKDKRVKQLEGELTSLREDMRSIIESQEAANEELQSANEEIVSSNEELQSMNEELETSKEEIESSNEELITINQELQVRNEQLAESVEYSEAVFTTIREGLLILDKDFRVKSANAAFYKTFRLTEDVTEGMLVYDLADRAWNIPKLHRLLDDALRQTTTILGFGISHYFPGIGEKTLLLNATRLLRKAHAQEVILIAFEDITEFTEAQKVLAERESWFRNMADNAAVMISVINPSKLVTFFNKSWLEFRGLQLDEAIGKSWTEGVHPDDLALCVKTYDKHYKNKEPFEFKYRVQRYDGEYRLLLNKSKPNYNHDGEFIGYISSCVELNEA
jgi:two-component system, chemotaxis family, CheB/CheR fusion protein